MTASNKSKIANRLRSVFVQSLALNLTPEETCQIKDLGSVAGLDSLSLLEFVAGLEKEFSCQIEPDCLNLAFLGDLELLTEYFSNALCKGKE